MNSKKIFSLFLPLAIACSVQAQQRPNVLFICVDDLRPDLGCYGNPEVHSPNIDAFAEKAVVFRKQYVTVPTCGASRISMLTGRYPRTKAALSNDAAEKLLANLPRNGKPETFIENMRRNGYYTVGIGKISHSADGYVYPYTASRSNQLELPNSWDEMLMDPGKWKTGWNAFFAYADGSNRQSRKGNVKPYEAGQGEDDAYPDGLTATLAVQKLKELSAKGQPFFLGVGFFKPHLPFNAPKKYWDMYDESKLSLTPSPDIPENVNAASLHPSAEFASYKAGDERASLKDPVSDAYARKLRHAYYAAVSYMDAQVGKVLEALKQNGLDENTIVIIWGDHGWQLGDDRVWGKHTLFEWSLRSAFLVRTPGMEKGFICDRVISSADIYPTLMQLCNLSSPVKTDGNSFAGLLASPDDATWRDVAYSYFRQGVSMRTPRYRLTKYFREAQPAVELYDHETDPFENKNIAATQPALIAELMKTWEKGNTGLFSK
ncbi:sulfatase [Chitinophaga cymbidii]|uniref:Iduronate-2-sulfatase n=1 Tax=Chitinophaga cymbidii TaxID=1096750 RepID=A0A512RRJ0_9BACT|nr:sulfatase [Chitinophaga cymbidii]GEP98294.1 iduronate-2-sulfatase [Chitinophaga cymbidii]